MTLVYAPGGLVSVPPAPIRGSGAPPANFKGQLGQMYLDTSVSPADIYFYNGLTWQISTAELDTLTTDDATVVVPVSGNINLLGGSNINTTGSGDDATINLDNSPSVSGSLTAGTTITATLGNITATNGNLALSTAGNKIIIATGANASVGTSAAMTAGEVIVATTASSATVKIFYSRATTGGTTGDVSITAQDGTGFTLTSTSNTETSTFNWWIINA